MKLVKPHMKIQKASEDYLESMLMMKEQHGYIRSVDVADHLGVTKPSVTYATKRLRENGYIENFSSPSAWTKRPLRRMRARSSTTSASRHTTRSASTQGCTFECRINGPMLSAWGRFLIY